MVTGAKGDEDLEASMRGLKGTNLFLHLSRGYTAQFILSWNCAPKCTFGGYILLRVELCSSKRSVQLLPSLNVTLFGIRVVAGVIG